MASKYDCSNPFGFCEIAFLMIFSFFLQKKLRYKKLTELEFRNLKVGCCQGTIRGCKS